MSQAVGSASTLGVAFGKAQDKANLDLVWLRDATLEDAESLPAPEVLAREIVDDLEAALAEFSAVADALEKAAAERGQLT